MVGAAREGARWEPMTQEETTTGIGPGLFADAQADPYPLYDVLRANGRVHWFPPGIWLVTRYDDCLGLLRDERLSSDPTASELYQLMMPQMFRDSSPAAGMVPNLLLFMDPPDHTRLRRLVGAAFTRGAVEALRPRIGELASGILDRGREAGSLDVVADLAYPLPVTVIAELLGVPVSDQDRFGVWARDLIALLGQDASPEMAERADAAVLAFNEYFTDLAEERRTEPREDLLTHLVEAEVDGETLTNDELLATCILLLLAGHETTANLIGIGTLNLLRHPDVLARLRDDPSLITTAVEELLRFDSPVQATARTTLEPIEIADKQIEAGQRVMVMLACANRDPDVFDRPNELVVDRRPNPHIGLGGGIHFCLGAPLARLEARVVFEQLVALPRLELACDEVNWRPSFAIRGLEALPVAL